MDGAAVARAEELRSQAVAEFSAGRPATARRLIARALHRLEGAEGSQTLAAVARVQVSRALTEFERSGLEAGLAALRTAAELAEQAAAVEVVPLVHSQRAMLLLRSGDLAAALAELNHAASHLSLMSPRDQVVVLLNRGTLYMQLGSLATGRRDLTQASEVGMQHHLGELTWKVRHNLAYLEYVAGDLPTSLSQMRAVAESMDEVHPGVPLDHGRVLLEAGLVREAQHRFAVAERLAAERGLKHERGEALVELARASLLGGEFDDARAQARLAHRLFLRRGSEGWRGQADLITVVAQVVSCRTPAATARRATDLASRFAATASRDLEAYARLLAAEAFIGAGDLAAAGEQVALSRRGQRYLPSSRRLYASLVSAKLADARGDRAATRRIMRRAADALAIEQGRSASLDVRAARSLHGRRLGGFAVGLAVADGSARGAFEVTERWLAASNRLPPVEPPDDPELAGLTSELRQLREQQRESGGEGTQLSGQIAQLERRIREREWHGAGASDIEVTRPISLTALQRVLRAAQADLVTYFTHGDDLWAVVVTPRRATLRKLARHTDVSELVSRTQADLHALHQPMLHPAIASSVRASLARRLDELEALLAAPLRLQHERLVVVPSYAVMGLPWGMLRSRRGRPTTVATSATRWATPPRPPGAAGPSIFATAGPGLEAADREVDAVAATWPQAVVVHAGSSTESGLVHALRTRDVVHIAAHGEHNPQNPLFSSVRLGDGVLFAHELQRGGVSAQHVILSACDVGRATMRPGDEALGLTASLLALGARNVIAAVTPVPDDTAHKVMAAYHENLASGTDASAALALASEVDELGGVFCSFGADWTPAGR